jgi:rod shape determining protein RodA
VGMFEGAAGRVERIGRERVRSRGWSERSPIRHLDPTLLVTSFALTIFGIVMVYSATYARLRNDGLSERQFLDRQVAFAVAAAVLMMLVATFSYRRLKAWAPIVYGASLFLLVMVLSPVGAHTAGAQRWFDVAFLRFQPAEVSKLAVIVMLASVLSERRGQPGPRDVFRSIVLVAVPALFIYLEPDLGTLLVLLAILFGMLLVSGTRLRLLLVLVALGALAFWGVLHLGLLKDYQLARLTAFLDASSDSRSAGYNLNQSKISIGSGGVFGKGLLSGSQTNLAFVPEVHTDFIFTVVGEELGFLGASLMLGLFAVFLWRAIRIALISPDLFGSLLASGIAAMLMFQVFVNVGMTLGISPITGIPLPFVSYGGSSLMTTFLCTGVLLNIHMRRLSQ